MTKFIEVSWTTDSIDEARKVCRYLVQEGVIASAQLVPWVESIYRWNNQVETSQESKVILMTRIELFDKIKQVISKNSRYEIPEIYYTEIDGISDDYSLWLNESTPDLPTFELT